ncbi:MAG: SEL1-like repeat protein [Novosphingobium sp.]|jgi:cell division septation protein DedD|nr:SEL1-like repeat protein [Novosphingobium sp.]
MGSALIRRTLLAGVALYAALPALSPALADVKAGVDAWSRGDYATAIKEWRPPAEKGDADAQFNLAQAYKLGRGVPTDLAKAEELFARAAAQGHLQASDNYGLLLFQRGAHAQAMPYIQRGAERGDARAQYLLGIAHFNGENVPKDWIRAYALVSLAQQAGLAQATPALTQMDQYIPLDQRQKSVSLAAELATQAEAARARQLAAFDLGTLAGPAAAATPAARRGSAATPAPSSGLSADSAAAAAARVSGTGAPGTKPAPATPTPVKPAPIRPAPVRPTPAPDKAPAAPRPAAATPGGVWRVQLGAFAVPGNAEALWNRVRNRPEVAGHPRLLLPGPRASRLQASGYASQGDAQAACRSLAAAGFPCIVMRN